MGGDCIGSDLVFLSTGYDYLKMVIDVAVGKPPKFVREGNRNSVFIKFIFSKDDLKPLEIIRRDMPESIYKVNISESIRNIGKCQVTDSSTRFGYYIIIDKSTKKLKDILNNAKIIV